MAWKYKDQLKINGGLGLPAGFFRKRSDPTVRQAALQELEKRLKKLDIPKSYAQPLLRLNLRPKALRELLGMLAQLIQEREAAKGSLSETQARIRELLKH